MLRLKRLLLVSYYLHPCMHPSGEGFARSQALLGYVVLQAGACLVDSQSGDWELAQTVSITVLPASCLNLGAKLLLLLPGNRIVPQQRESQ
jgi:hypothetical protein